METFEIRYRFSFPDNSEKNYIVRLDARTLDLVYDSPHHPPSWARIDVHQCPNCTLDMQSRPYCPAAVCLVDLVDGCTALLSHDVLRVEVTTPERIVSKETTAQRGVSSLMGLLMATSGCPHMRFFKPMARFHLPLASEEETIYRATSMYLLAQYFIQLNGGEADLKLQGLKAIYENIRLVNRSLAERLRAASREDSSINALIILDLFAKALPYVIQESLDELRYLFSPYLGDGQII